VTTPFPFTGEGNRGEAAGGRGRALARAREMRREPTEAKGVLWRLLRAYRLADWKCRHRQPLGPYSVDFICLEARVIVEADGSQHLENQFELHRDAWLRSQNFRVLRLWNNDVLARPEQVREAIYNAVNGAADAPPAPLPGPLPQREREQKEDPSA